LEEKQREARKILAKQNLHYEAKYFKKIEHEITGE
jgi:hypothetical protein